MCNVPVGTWLDFGAETAPTDPSDTCTGIARRDTLRSIGSTPAIKCLIPLTLSLSLSLSLSLTLSLSLSLLVAGSSHSRSLITVEAGCVSSTLSRLDFGQRRSSCHRARHKEQLQHLHSHTSSRHSLSQVQRHKESERARHHWKWHLPTLVSTLVSISHSLPPALTRPVSTWYCLSLKLVALIIGLESTSMWQCIPVLLPSQPFATSSPVTSDALVNCIHSYSLHLQTFSPSPLQTHSCPSSGTVELGKKYTSSP